MQRTQPCGGGVEECEPSLGRRSALPGGQEGGRHLHHYQSSLSSSSSLWYDHSCHQLFQIVGAQLQHITWNHWLPNILGPEAIKGLGSYPGWFLYPGLKDIQFSRWSWWIIDGFTAVNTQNFGWWYQLHCSYCTTWFQKEILKMDTSEHSWTTKYYPGYNPHIDPSISNVFSTAALRSSLWTICTLLIFLTKERLSGQLYFARKAFQYIFIFTTKVYTNINHCIFIAKFVIPVLKIHF